MAQLPTHGLFYITHIDNVPSILHLGILSHERVEKENIPYTPIYDAQIIAGRRERTTPDGRSLWSFANLYFQPRNAMLYRVISERGSDKIVLIHVNPNIQNRKDILISTGNAASSYSDILPRDKGLREISKLRKVLTQEWWSDVDASKRKMMAECLVPEHVPPESVQGIYVANHETAEQLRKTIGQSVPVIPELYMFFRPRREIDLLPRLSLVEGDMFFSKLQTLTVSVNTVGVMGAGLASRAKYQFPDVYVLYQDLCRQRRLGMGKPYLYKREVSLDRELADDPSTLVNANAETWFLLFATKRHWRERADIKGIEEGLQWLKENYGREGIKSLAVPALGCGLGRLDWRDVGPLMCRYLSSLSISVEIYLPAEQKVQDEFLTKEFLLQRSNLQGQGAFDAI